MKRVLSACAVLAVGALLASLFRSEPAAADVPISQQVMLLGEAPVSGSYANVFTDYGGSLPSACTGALCEFKGYRVSRGNLTVKLSSYRLTERDRGYDYYIVDTNAVVTSKSGSYLNSAGSMLLSTSVSGGVVSMGEAKAVDGKERECKSISLSMSTPWPYLGASAK